MKRNVLVVVLVFILLASACAPKGTPTANPADIQSTAAAAAMTIVAQTQAALPTATPFPPTETASPIPLPTNTPFPLPTQEGAVTQEGAATLAGGLPTNLPTFTPQASSNSGNAQDPCNQPLTSWQGESASFMISNQTKPKGSIILSMFVRTTMGQCGYLIITGDSFTGPVGDYSAGAFITGKKDMKSFGSFRITPGNWKIVVKNDSITAGGGCYPSC